jgi:hypothetical protein
MPAVLLATCADLPAGDEDADALVAALAARGVDAGWAVWTDRGVDWSRALTVIRSTWDYTYDRDAFLAWARSVRRLVNPPDVVEWNSDKTYLRDLADAGLPVVPTAWSAPGEAVELPVAGEFVVKPSIGAGSKGAGRFSVDAAGVAREHVARLHDAGRIVLVQPYLAEIDTAGETSLIYIDGTFSHAIGKAAMLPEGVVHPVGSYSLYVEERISPRAASADELAVGSLAVNAIRDRFGADQLYARVDLLPTPDGPVVIELELTEPSLFLGHAAGAVDVFAAAIADRA